MPGVESLIPTTKKEIHLYCGKCDICRQLDVINSKSKNNFMNTLKRSELKKKLDISARIIELPTRIRIGEQYGIENIKESFEITMDLSKKVYLVIKDFSYPALIALGIELAQFKTVLPVFKQALKEFKDLDTIELNELHTHFKEVFDIENDSLEEKIENGIDLIIDIYDHFEKTLELYHRAEDYLPTIRKAVNKENATTVAA